MKYVFLRRVCALTLGLLVMSVQVRSAEAATIRTDAHAVNSQHTKGLMVLVFTLRAFGTDMYLPATAARAGSHGSEKAGAVFSIIDSSDAVTATGTTNALILGTTTIKNGMYKIKEGTRATFALATFIDTPGTEDARYRLLLSELNYFKDVVGKEQVAYDLPPTPLMTPSVKLTK